MDIQDVDSAEVVKKLREQAQDQIKTATDLMLMKNTEGWKILLNTFEDMKEDQLAVLSKLRPGDDKSILAAHAVWYSVLHTLNQIVGSVDSAINAGIEAKQTLDDLTEAKNEDWP